jgi:dipeptidyl aminopeptidase/acylaminoacyl peptidase
MKSGVIATAVRAGAFLLCAMSSASAQSHPPVEAFGNLPAIRDPVLSPDGKYLAAVQTVDGKPVAVIYQVNASQGTKPAFVASPDGFIVAVQWAKADRLAIIEKSNRHMNYDMYLRTWWRALTVDPNGQNPVLLFKGDKSLWFNVATAAIFDVDLDDPDNVFMPILDQAGSQQEVVVDLAKVNVRDGSAKVFQEGVISSAGWIMDGHGHVAAQYAAYPHERAMHVKIPEGERLRELAAFPTGEDSGVGTEGITEDGTSLVMSLATAQKRDGLFAVDLKTARTISLLENPEFDIDTAVHDEWTGRVIGGIYIDDKPEFIYFNPTLQHLQKTLETAFPGRSVRLVSSDVARTTYIVETDSPQEPATYYFFDAKTHHASVIGTAYPQLPADSLGVMKPMSYAARDGLTIHGYLTVPPGSDGKNMPLVVMPHGGPVARDELHFDWWAQFLANRGYAVFQPNFRGSSGYGQDFVRAGHGQWGLKMQDDITDGVRKLIADGSVDPKRICIVGASYGGYAALAGAAFTPDLYACAVSYAGVSDLDLMLSRDLHHVSEEDSLYSILAARIGDPSRDSARIAATSPAKHADQIKIPVLLMHASDDTTVLIEQSVVMNEALQKAGKNVRFVKVEGDDHYLDLSSTRIRLLNETEQFLKANIGAGTVH